MSRIFIGTLSRGGKVAAALLGIVIFSMLAAAVYFYRQPPLGSSYTDFYVLSTSGQAYAYPAALASGETGKVILSIANFEKKSAAYRIEMIVFGQSSVVLENEVLPDGAKWQGTVEFSPLLTDADHLVLFMLFKDGSETPYRTLRLNMAPNE